MRGLSFILISVSERKLPVISALDTGVVKERRNLIPNQRCLRVPAMTYSTTSALSLQLLELAAPHGLHLRPTRTPLPNLGF